MGSKMGDPNQVMELLQPVPDEALKFYRGSTKVNSGRNQGEGLIEAVEEIAI